MQFNHSLEKKCKEGKLSCARSGGSILPYLSTIGMREYTYKLEVRSEKHCDAKENPEPELAIAFASRQAR